MSSILPYDIVSHDMEVPSAVAPVVPVDSLESHSVVFPGAEVTVLTVDDGDQDSKLSSLCDTGKRVTWLFATTTILIVLCVVLAVVFSAKGSVGGNGNPVKTLSPAHDNDNDNDYEERFTVFRNALITKSDPTAFFDPASPPSLALQWLVYQDQTISLDNLDRLTQRYVIMVLYYACGGENWRGYTTPFVEEVETYECDWKDFGCDKFGNISSIKLDQRGMVGRLPFEIGLLSALTELDLFDNDLEGAIPDSIYGLEKLKTLSLGLNRFSSTLSPQIGKLTNLEVLRLYRNSMTGSLPSSVARLSNLEVISLGHTDLEGPITPYLSNWPDLKIIDIKHSLLTGSLPTTIGLLTKLEMFVASYSQLQGTIPSKLALLSNTLGVLMLGGPNLEGTLPESIGELTLLKSLYIRAKAITGTIPSAFGKLTQLEWMLLGDAADLTGPLPSELGSLSLLSILEFQGSGITGTVPTELGRLNELVWFNVLRTDLEGDIPESVCASNPEILYDCSLTCECCPYGCTGRPNTPQGNMTESPAASPV